MNCPKCDQVAYCIDSREWHENTRRRRWECKDGECKTRFTTVEQIVDVGNHAGGIPRRQRGNKLERFRRDQEAGQIAKVVKELRSRVLAAFDAQL